MSFVLRGADVIDGTGSPKRRADVHVDGGVIQAVGVVPAGAGAIDVDVAGLVVSPGFIDIHTHYDAQVLWDTALTPSCWHGVTSVVMGNCGFGVAPARPQNRELVLGILELVEDMAPDALAAGVRWDFESFPEYLDVIDRLAKRINVAAFIGHTPVRVDVMGDAAMDRGATPSELAAMGRIVRDARRAGAIGIASSLATNHVGPGGRNVPSYVGSVDELAHLIEAMGSGVVEIARGRTPIAELRRCLRRGVTLSWSSLLTSRPGETTSPGELLAQTVALGDDVWPQVSCRPVTIQVALANPIALGVIGAFREILAAAPEAREAMYRDEAWQSRARHEVADNWRPIWARATALAGGVEDPIDGIALVDHAARRGLDLFDALIDLALEVGLQTRFNIPVANLDEDQLGALLRHPRTIIGLSDAGAHANQQCDASFATHLLGYWVRDKGALSLEHAVWRLTGQPAQVYGFAGRGLVRPGCVADLVAFDPATVSAQPLERAHDFPGGTDRLVSRSRGIHHVWVAGTAIRLDEVDLDVHPGSLLRAPVSEGY